MHSCKTHAVVVVVVMKELTQTILQHKVWLMFIF